MGVRDEIFSTNVQLQNRTYFFNVKENRKGDLYLNMVESKNNDGGGFERQSIVIFADDLQQVLKGFDESLRFMEKAAYEKKRARPPRPRSSDSGGRQDRPFKKFEDRERGGDRAEHRTYRTRERAGTDRTARTDRTERPERPFKKFEERDGSRRPSSGRPARDDRTDRPRKRVVVRARPPNS